MVLRNDKKAIGGMLVAAELSLVVALPIWVLK
jgi:hypothetical protein